MGDSHEPDPIPALAAARAQVRAAITKQREVMLSEAWRALPGAVLTVDDGADPCVWWRMGTIHGIAIFREFSRGAGWRWEVLCPGDLDSGRGTGDTIAAALDDLATQSRGAARAVRMLRAEVPRG